MASEDDKQKVKVTKLDQPLTCREQRSQAFSYQMLRQEKQYMYEKKAYTCTNVATGPKFYNNG